MISPWSSSFHRVLPFASRLAILSRKVATRQISSYVDFQNICGGMCTTFIEVNFTKQTHVTWIPVVLLQLDNYVFVFFNTNRNIEETWDILMVKKKKNHRCIFTAKSWNFYLVAILIFHTSEQCCLCKKKVLHLMIHHCTTKGLGPNPLTIACTVVSRLVIHRATRK